MHTVILAGLLFVIVVLASLFLGQIAHALRLRHTLGQAIETIDAQRAMIQLQADTIQRQGRAVMDAQHALKQQRAFYAPRPIPTTPLILFAEEETKL